MPELMTHPDFREIDTPWEPQSISWRFHKGERANTAQLEQQVADLANTHVVREVEVAISPYGGIVPVDQTWADLSLAEEHFDQLASYPGLAVANHQWHVFQDAHGLTRTLARVEIVDGEKLDFAHPSERVAMPAERREALELFDEAMKRYAREVIGHPLVDIYNLYQWRFGMPRAQAPNPLAVKALHLIDIEPMFFLRGRLQ